MASMRVSLEEQETTINIYPSPVQNYAEVYSCIPGMMKKLRKFAAEYPDEVRIEKEDDIGIFVQMPARWIQIRRPKQMHLTEEQREATAERLREARAKRERSSDEKLDPDQS